MHQDILRPVIGLVGWSLVMLVWTLFTRFPAMKAAGVDIRKLTGTKGSDADRVLPAKAQWPAHNYNHLMEQPTIFYAAAITIALTGAGNGSSAWLAWAYVAFRILHSIVQATVNRVGIRFYLFLASTLCLMALALQAAKVVFDGQG